MQPNNLMFKAATVPLLICLLQMFVFSTLAGAQEVSCPYDRANPSLDNARISFKSLNYDCAEKEILDYLTRPSLTIEDKANAHVLLAAVYYAKLKNDKEKRSRVIEQFKQAFMAYREWRGELDISSTEFIDMMKEAQVQVDQEAKEAPPAVVETAKPEEKETPAVVPPTETAKAAKPWYTQWWAIGLGVGLVAAVVAVAAGGGGGDDGGGGGAVTDTLPDFPDPPSGK